ncbi:MAG: hypothetical protein ACPGVU_18010 [Limisphaerales bacterium]
MPENDEQPNPRLDEVREILFGDLVERVKKLESAGALTGAAGIIRRIDELEASFHREMADLREQLRAEKASRVSADTQQEEDSEEKLNVMQGRIDQLKERVDRNAFEIRKLISDEGKRLEKQLERRGEEQASVVRQSLNELQKRRGS